MVKNTLSVDLESFIHRQLNTKKRIESENGETALAIKYLLDIFDKYNTKVTFFVLGEIYEWYPDLIEEIKKRGHEIGYHGHRHILFRNRETLLEDLKLSKKFLDTYKPIGFRAPRMFLKKEYLKILSDFGFKYDSSVYGQQIEDIREFGIKEIPVSLSRYFGNSILNKFPQGMRKELLLQGIPYGSGLFISLLQKKIQYFIEKSHKKNIGSNLFIHPWQLSGYKETGSLPLIQKLSYRKKVDSVIEYLLGRNKFFPLKELV
ncbi:MAG: polysaccharide deacetylase family protein [Candidatus Levybacteria bacterium]|nr:polysaccharide deacetylase family protein [Candidatus Levybacteria bacterium]